MAKTHCPNCDERVAGDHEIECTYCGVSYPCEAVPAIDDDAAWARLSRRHANGCEWVLTRAHRRSIEHPPQLDKPKRLG